MNSPRGRTERSISRLSKDVFPAPFGPMTPRHSPAFVSKLTSTATGTTPKLLLRALTFKVALMTTSRMPLGSSSKFRKELQIGLDGQLKLRPVVYDRKVVLVFP